jgi:two-component system, cell cycle sensor histidine kinase and response regulator CckA
MGAGGGMAGLSVTSLHILSGLCAYAALNHFSQALRRPKDLPHLLLAGMCFVLAILGLSGAAAYQAFTISGFVSLIKLNLSLFPIFFILFIWFFAVFTGFRPRKWLLAWTVLFALLIPVNLMQPYGLQYTVIYRIEALRLPWGEKIAFPAGRHGFIFWLGALAVVLNLGFAFRALWAAWRRDRSHVSLTMLIAMVFFLITGVEGILVRASIIRFIHLGLYGGILTIITISIALSRDTSQRLSLLDFALDNVHEAAFLSDHGGRLHYVNAESCRALGYGREEMLRLTVADIDPDLPAKRWASHWEELKRKGSLVFQSRHRSKDGRILPVEISANYFTFAGRSYNLSLVRDISMRIQAEEAVKKERQRFYGRQKRALDTIQEREQFIRNILETVDEGFVVLDRDCRVLSANRAYCDLVDLPESRVIGHLCHECSQAKVIQGFEKKEDCPVRRTFATGDAQSTLHIHTDAAGKKRHVELKTYPIFHGKGEVSSVIETITDVTENKRLEEQLRQAQKMEAIGTLAGGVAHDFNNMLSVIIGYTELALEQVDPSLDLFSNLQEIRQAAGRSADLTRQLLTFARKQAISPRLLHVNETVEGMLKMLQRLIGESVEIVWRPGADVWPLRMDPSQFDQILANLCVNARDAIAGVGTITIETRNAVFDERDCAANPEASPGRYVLLAVSDDGCGMDGETLSKIFEPFFTTKKDGKGTGLGLPTVYGIIKQNHGLLDVYSEPGAGTTFKIYLPWHPVEASELRESAQPDPLLRGSETILLVEDAQPILNMVIRMLENFGYKVMAASSPAEAIHTAADHPAKIDLLLTDVVMPGMNGRDLAKKISTIQPGIKCLFMSGYMGGVIADLGMLEEDIHFIQKPFSVQTLAAKLRETLDAT